LTRTKSIVLQHLGAVAHACGPNHNGASGDDAAIVVRDGSPRLWVPEDPTSKDDEPLIVVCLELLLLPYAEKRRTIMTNGLPQPI
jgi:hypothetical protein